MGLLDYCQRCGNVGFHSEACIAASSAERIAAQQMAALHDCSMAVEAERQRIKAAVHEDIAPETLVFRDEDPRIDPRPVVYVPLAAVLAALDGEAT